MGFGNEALSIKFQMGQGDHMRYRFLRPVMFLARIMIWLYCWRSVSGSSGIFINHVPFHAVNHLLVIFLRQVLNLGKCLNHAVVRNSYGQDDAIWQRS